MPFFKNVFRKIKDTVKGDTKVGSVLHEVLPMKKTREAVGAAILGIKKASPLPELKDPKVRSEVEEAVGKIKSQNLEGLDSQQLLNIIYQVRDILDDGKQNQSIERLSLKVRKLIIQSFSALPLIAYIIYGITTGEWNLGDLLNYVGAFLGI